MTRQQFETELAKIGWKIEKSTDNVNDFIINHFGERTAFCIYQNERLEIRTPLFGSNKTSLGRGAISFNLNNLSLNSGSNINEDRTDWISIEFGNNNYIHFYNFER